MPGIKAVKPDYPGLFPKARRRRMQKARTAIITYITVDIKSIVLCVDYQLLNERKEENYA